MGINNLALLFPGDDFVPDTDALVVSTLSDGQFSVSSSDFKVSVPVGGSFSVTSPQATNNGDGTFTVSSE